MPTTNSIPVDPMEIRDVRFDLSPVPADWHGAGRSVGIFFNNVSLFLPEAERYFIATMKAARRSAQTPEQQRGVDTFCAQEGHHSREHVRYNAWVARDIPIAPMERRILRMLELARRKLSPRRQLGTTCAFEHYTAVLAALVLREPATLKGADPTVSALWRWHAAEENEHKAVAFDLFRAAGGTFRERVVTMLLATVAFWGLVMVNQVGMMRAAGILFSPREWRKLLWFLFIRPAALTRLILPLCAYFRPSFHPNDSDTAELTVQWRRQFAVDDVYRRAMNP